MIVTALVIFGVLLLSAFLAVVTLLIAVLGCLTVESIMSWCKDEPTFLFMVWTVLFVCWAIGLGTIFLGAR